MALFRGRRGRESRPAPQAPEGLRRIEFEYPLHPRARWGENGAAPHARIAAMLDARRAEFAAVLRGFLQWRDDLLAIPVGPDHSDETAPFWDNTFLTGLDAVALYGFLRARNPRRYVEVGSGNSTRFVRRAVRDGGLRTLVTSIDPEPRADIDALCDEVIRAGLESVDPAFFDELEAGDVVFVDGSHYVYMNSDAVAAFLDVFPRLKPGVLYGVHDVFLPYDYPAPLHGLHFTEQYLLGAALVAGPTAFSVALPTAWATQEPDMQAVLAPLWEAPENPGIPRHGSIFWMRKETA